MKSVAYEPGSELSGLIAERTTLAAEAGLVVGVRNADANAKRPDGLMLYIAGLRTNGDGVIFAPEPAPTPTEAAP